MKKIVLVVMAVFAAGAVFGQNMRAGEILTAFDRAADAAKTGNWELAISETTRILNGSSDENIKMNAYSIRVVAYSSVENWDRAIADASACIDLILKLQKEPDPPESAPQLLESNYFYRGNAYFKKEDYRRAIADFDQAVRLNPKKAVYYGNRSLTHLYMGSKAQALQDAEKALSIDPKNVEAGIVKLAVLGPQY